MAVAFGVRAVQLALSAEVARTYFELRGAQRELRVAQRNAENQRHTLQLTNDRLDAGRGTALDRERATAQLNSTLALVPVLETRVAAAINRLGVLVGGSTAEWSTALVADTTFPAIPDRPAIDSVAAFVRARPDVRSAERAYAAQRTLVGAAKSDYFPRVNITAGAGYNGPKADSLGAVSSRRYAIGPVISWPLLDLGRVKTHVDVAKARAEEERARYDQVVLTAEEETQNALVAFDRAKTRLGYLRAAEEASERGADLARMRFTNGASDFLEVLDAERTLLEQQDQLVRGETDAVTAFVLLYKALGGVWPDSAH